MLMRKFISTLCVFFLTTGLLFSVLASRKPQGLSPAAKLTPQVVTLIINEYLADPAAGAAGDANGDGTSNTTQDEFVELVNSRAVPLDISGFTVSDALQVRFTVPAGKIIPPGEAAVVFGGGTPAGTFGNAAANGLVFSAGGAGLSLNNAGDTITVKDSSSSVVVTLTYGSSEGNADQSITRSPDIAGGFTTHSSAAGSGGALFSPGKRVNGSPFTTTDPVIASVAPDVAVVAGGNTPITVTGSNFQAASHVRVDGSMIDTSFGTAMTLDATIPASVINMPGAHAVTVENPGPVISNSVTFTVLPAIGINEYLADPPGSSPGDLIGDANGDGTRDSSQDEFVEVINRTSTPVKVGGYTISDADSVRFTFPPGTIIPAGEVAVVFGGGTPTGDFGNAHANNLVFTAALSLNNAGDTITLKDNLNSTVESLTYGSTQGNADQSITQSPDITGGFVNHSTATGSGGRLFSPGTRVDGSTFTAPNPVINSISPSAAIVGSGDVPITVTGSHFQAASVVRMDGSPIDTSFGSAMTLNATIPASVTNVPGAHAVTVENPGPVISNSVTFTVLAAIGINEYLADPPGSAPGDLIGDANGDGTRDSSQDEFVEVINRTNIPVNVGGYTLSDADNLRFTFPAGTIIPASEAAVIFGGGTPMGEFGNALFNGLVFTAALSLNNGGDTITIKDPSAVVIESVTYGTTEGNANQSINRDPDLPGIAFATHSSIAGSGGRLFSPGARVNGAPFTSGPRITSIDPESARQGDPPFDMALVGSGFDGASQVFIDGQSVATMFISSDQLSGHVPANILAASGPHQVQVRNEGGNRSNPVTLTIIPPPPILESLLPSSVIVGSGQFQLFLTGLNFDSLAAALVEGTPVATTFISSNVLRATVPATFTATLGAHLIVVRNSDGRESNAAIFNVIAPTTVITSISPATAIAGGPSLELAVKGANFKSNAKVFFDQTELVTTLVSISELSANVPASLISGVGIHGIAVQNPDETRSNETVFQVLPDPPLIGSIEPAGVIAGSGDVTVTISGLKFQRGAVVRIVEGLRRGAALDTTFISSERLQARVPDALTRNPGTVSLGVENPDFGFSNVVALKVLIKDPLVINEYLADPPEGAAGDANGDGTRSSSSDEFVEILNRSGDPLDISGFKLFDADAVRHVFPPGTLLPPFEAAVVFGGGTPTGAFGNAADNHLVFKASTGGLSLNNGGDTIVLQDAQGRIVQEIKVSAAEGGAGQSINRDPDGDGSTFAIHTIVAADASRLFSPGTKAAGQTFTIKPRIGSLTPGSIRVGSQQFALTVSGSNFLPGAVVLFGNTALPTVYRSDALLEAQVSAALVAEAGAADVRVRNPRGELSGSVRLLITDDPPRVLRITPETTGTGAVNLEISIGGERFQRGAAVLIQGEAVETRFVSSTALVAIAPSSFFARAAELPLVVVNADGNRSNSLTLTVENGPLITRLSKGKVKAGRGIFELTVGGVAFKPGVVLFVNDIAVSTTFASDASFTARIPAEMTSQPGVLILQARHPDGGRSNTAKLKVK
ncbi:MAG: lamin tail domain-containing protein [Acidobacteriota bacterium]